MKKNTADRGNTLADAREFTERAAKAGLALMKADRFMRGWSGAMDMVITEIRVRRDRADPEQIMIMIKLWNGTREFVAWSSGPDVPSAIQSAVNRFENATLKLQDDKFSAINKDLDEAAEIGQPSPED